ncbi:MAG: hypothetical protein ABIQ89_04510, partial [Candidatus Saccharimonadales bacterium]
MAKKAVSVLGTKTKHGLRRVRSHVKPVAKKTAAVSVIVARHTKKGAKLVHHHVAVRPHNHLMKKDGRYKKWHEWRFHHHVHYSGLTVFTILVLLLVAVNVRNALAASDLNDSWDFTSSAPYTIDPGIETSGSVARLKAQNYTSDANTVALYHLDETSGSTAADSSANANNATSTNSPSFGTGNLNNGATFDGVDDTLKVADSVPLSFNFANSLEAWTKFDTAFSNNSNDNRQTILDKGSYK